MYLCNCKAVSEQAVSEAIKTEGQCLDRIQQSCGAGTKCGGCRVRLEQYVNNSTQTTTAHAADDKNKK